MTDTTGASRTGQTARARWSWLLPTSLAYPHNLVVSLGVSPIGTPDRSRNLPGRVRCLGLGNGNEDGVELYGFRLIGWRAGQPASAMKRMNVGHTYLLEAYVLCTFIL